MPLQAVSSAHEGYADDLFMYWSTCFGVHKSTGWYGIYGMLYMDCIMHCLSRNGLYGACQ